MLYLTDDFHAQNPGDWTLWHTGERVPMLRKEGIVYIQASGKELNLILAAMQASWFTKQRKGLFRKG